jgi:Protein of unknown function (DUF3800)
MLVFLDESGDTSFKIESGSSPYFTVALVLFEETDEAQAADDRIQLLKRELGKPEAFEFHFKENSDAVRQSFFSAVAPYSFFYFGIVIDKAKVYGESLTTKDAFYKYVCGLIFESAKPYLDNAIVKIDRSGNRDFQNQLSSYLKKKINPHEHQSNKHIQKVVSQDSASNNLLQLADMVCGAITRSYRRDHVAAERFRRQLRHRELGVRLWPTEVE